MNTAQPLARRPWLRHWPWALLGLLAAVATWYVLDFEEDVDPEYPKVARVTFNARPSPAYRLAEPGDTLDRVAIYLSAGAIVASSLAGVVAWRNGRSTRPWIGALAVSVAAFWYAANPGPTFDGWHGLGWRTLRAASAPLLLRGALAVAAVVLVALAAWGLSTPGLRERLRERQASALFVGAVVLALAGQFEIPGVEPIGFWPRWAVVGALTLWVVVLCRLADRSSRRGPVLLAGMAAWVGIVLLGIGLTWYHRPLERLHTVVPGQIYISAMPTYRGLQVADARHHFKTIINLFPEGKLGTSPRLAEERKFAREHHIRYVQCTGETSESDAFLDETLRLAQDPAAWPILVHCHACMDRSPAWMGIYRFVVQGRSLRDVLREIESHRGYRPKSSVTLLYNRVLPPRAPAHYAADPDAALLRQCAAGTVDPFELSRARELAAGHKAVSK